MKSHPNGGAILAPKNTKSKFQNSKSFRASKQAAKRPRPVAHQPIPAGSEMALIRLADLYEDALSRPSDDAIACLCGLRDLIAHHPGLRTYHEALNWIVEGERFLNHSFGRHLPMIEHGMPVALRGAVNAVIRAYRKSMEARYEDAINDLSGVRDLITDHPKLHDYHQAITWMFDGHVVLMCMHQKARAL